MIIKSILNKRSRNLNLTMLDSIDWVDKINSSKKVIEKDGRINAHQLQKVYQKQMEKIQQINSETSFVNYYNNSISDKKTKQANKLSILLKNILNRNINASKIWNAKNNISNLYTKINYSFSDSKNNKFPYKIQEQKDKRLQKCLEIMFVEKEEQKYLSELFCMIDENYFNVQTMERQSQNQTQNNDNQFLRKFKKLSQFIDEILSQLTLDKLEKSQKLNEIVTNNMIHKSKTKATSTSPTFTQSQFKYQRQKFIIEVEERKLFYKRLGMFINKLIEDMDEVLVVHKERKEKLNSEKKRKQTKQQMDQAKRQAQIINNNLFETFFIKQDFYEIQMLKNNTNNQFQHNNKQNLTNQQASPQQPQPTRQSIYWQKSNKIKKFNIFNLQEYESNYSVKIRILIKLLGEIKLFYQNQLVLGIGEMFDVKKIGKQKKNKIKVDVFDSFESLSSFLEKRIISSMQYVQLIQLYFNFFSQKYIKNYLMSSISYHSTDISQISRQIIDVKLKQTQLYYPLQKLCSVFLIKPNEFLYNIQDDYNEVEYPQQSLNVNRNKKQEQNMNMNEKQKRQYNRYKTLYYEFVRMMANQLRKEKQKFVNKMKVGRQFVVDNNNSDVKQGLKNEIGLINQLRSQQQPFNEFIILEHYNASLNQLLPYSLFNVTNFTQIQTFLNKQISYLMFDPHQAYLSCAYRHKHTPNNDKKSQQQIQTQKLSQIKTIIGQLQNNIILNNRFQLWTFYKIKQVVDFSIQFMKNQEENLVREFRGLKEFKESFESKEQSQTISSSILTKQFATQLNYVTLFYRLINVIYTLQNNANPIYIIDYSKSLQRHSEIFVSFIQSLSKQIQVQSVRNLISIINFGFESCKGVGQVTQNELWMKSMLRFRILTVFLDMKLIKYKDFFGYLLDMNPQQINIPQKKKKQQINFSTTNLLFLYYSDGLQKTIRLIAQYRQKYPQQYLSFTKTNKKFNKFLEQFINKNQANFNNVLNQLEEINRNNLNSEEDEDQMSSQFLFKEFMKFLEVNDLIYKEGESDQEKFVKFLGRNGLVMSLEDKENCEVIDIGQKLQCSRTNFQNFYNVLLILSQNYTFLSSTVNLSYINYIKSLLNRYLSQYMRFSSCWNYPFYANLAITKKGYFQNREKKMYIKMTAAQGIRGFGKFFKDQGKLHHNFMGIQCKQDNNFTPFKIRLNQTMVYGVETQQKDIIQLKFKIDVSSPMIHLLRRWIQGYDLSIVKYKKDYTKN